MPTRLMCAVRWMLFTSCLTAVFATSSSCQSSGQKKLQVVILAVSNFDDHRWDNPLLQVNVEKSSGDLQKFFAARFPHAELHVLDSADKTRRAFISAFMRDDFKKLADGTLTLFFVLSHGMPYASPNPNFSEDLLVAASDTNHETGANALSVAKDFVPEFTALNKPGSIVIVFFDTCYSGSAQSSNMYVLKERAEEYGLRLMIMASSLSEAQSYRSTFSQALLDLWGVRAPNDACTDPQQAPPLLRKLIANRIKPDLLGPIEGFPKIIVPYRGKLCLESFAAENGLFVFLNTLPYTVAATVKANGKLVDNLSFPLPLETNDVVPYKAVRDRYVVEIERNDRVQLHKPLNVDLQREPISFVAVGQPDSAQLGSAFRQTANYADLSGLGTEQTKAYEKRAFAAFASVGLQEQAIQVAQKLRKEQPEDRDMQIAQAIAFPDTTRSPFVPLLGLVAFATFALSVLLLSLRLVLHILGRGILRRSESPLFGWIVRFEHKRPLSLQLAFDVGVLGFIAASGLAFNESARVINSTVPAVDEARLYRTEGPPALGRLELLSGRFREAARLYSEAAERSGRPSERAKFAWQAYLAYGASGQVLEASEFRRRFPLEAGEFGCSDCVQKEEAAVLAIQGLLGSSATTPICYDLFRLSDGSPNLQTFYCVKGNEATLDDPTGSITGWFAYKVRFTVSIKG